MNLKNFFNFLASFCFCAGFLAAAPVITEVSPAVGPSSGGSAVEIFGSGFTGTTSVRFDDLFATSFIVTSDSHIIAASPPHAPQVVNITVTTPSGSSSPSDTSFFTYQGNWKAFVPNSDDGTVSVIDTITNTVLATILVGNFPDNLDILPDGSRAYILNDGDSTLSVINTATNLVVNTITLPNFSFDYKALVVTPDGLKNYIVNDSSNEVTVIDNVTETVITTIPVGATAYNLAMTPDGENLYVMNFDDGTVSCIDVASDTVIATIPVGDFPNAAASLPDSSKVYVCGTDVTVIDTATNTVLTTIPVGFPGGIAVTPDGSEVLVTEGNVNQVFVIDTASDTVVDTINVGLAPTMINITPDGTKAYVVNVIDATVSVIDLSTDNVIDTIPVGDFPQAQAIRPDGKEDFVVSPNDDNVTVINTTTDNVVTTLTVGDQPTEIQITADQAPLAQFSFIAQPAGLPTTFDASGSNSPTGTIANYSWNFGDGSGIVNTSVPFITHVYQNPGNYTVTLVVTNTAGTSLTQIFYFSSYSAGFTNQGSPVTNNNGGPSAQRIHSLTISIAPPTNVTACTKKNQFLNRTEHTLNGTFTPSVATGVIFYRIFRNDEVILEIPASATSFTICLKSKNLNDAFSIATVTAGGMESEHVPIVVTGSCCQPPIVIPQ